MKAKTRIDKLAALLGTQQRQAQAGLSDDELWYRIQIFAAAWSLANKAAWKIMERIFRTLNQPAAEPVNRIFRSFISDGWLVQDGDCDAAFEFWRANLPDALDDATFDGLVAALREQAQAKSGLHERAAAIVAQIQEHDLALGVVND